MEVEAAAAKAMAVVAQAVAKTVMEGLREVAATATAAAGMAMVEVVRAEVVRVLGLMVAMVAARAALEVMREAPEAVRALA